MTEKFQQPTLNSPSTSPNDLENFWMPFSANRTFKEDPSLVVESEGIWLLDHRGKKVLDGSSGLFCCPLGHRRPEIADAVYQQIMQNDYVAPFQLAQPASFALANIISRLYPEKINHTFFVNSGSEAVDTAMKIALAYFHSKGEKQRTRFVSRSRAYHGCNMGGSSLSGMVRNRQQFGLALPYISLMRDTKLEAHRFHQGQPFSGDYLADDLEAIAGAHGGETIAACFVEPIAGSTGTLIPPVGYLDRLREICDHYGILLVFDEVITGFGRTGKPFASQSFGVTPDIMTTAKALTNGTIPMGGVAVSDDIFNTIDEKANGGMDMFHGYTYSGHPAACAAGIATQQIFEKENLYEKSAALAPYFAKAIHSLEDLDIVTDIRSYGLMAGIDVQPDAKGAGIRGGKMQRRLFKEGLHVKFTGDAAIIAPAFVYEESDIDHLVDLLRHTFSEEKI